MPVADIKGELNERLEVYIEAVSRKEDDRLRILRESAESNGIPVIRRSAERYIGLLLNMISPERILEIGTATGYSAAVMADACPDAHIDTVERDAGRADEAKDTIDKLGLSDRVYVFCGDAEDFLKDSRERYGFVFLDAAKGQYIRWWEDIKRILSADGVVVADNVLQEGSVLDSRFAVERRDRTIHERMRAFVKEVFSDEGFTADIIPIGDGLLVAKRLG